MRNLRKISSSRGVFPSDLHSYSKHRFIRPFAPPCSSWLSPSFLAGAEAVAGGKLGKAVRELEEGVVRKFLNNSIVQALVVVVVVVIV